MWDWNVILFSSGLITLQMAITLVWTHSIYGEDMEIGILTYEHHSPFRISEVPMPGVGVKILQSFSSWLGITNLSHSPPLSQRWRPRRQIHWWVAMINLEFGWLIGPERNSSVVGSRRWTVDSDGMWDHHSFSYPGKMVNRSGRRYVIPYAWTYDGDRYDLCLRVLTQNFCRPSGELGTIHVRVMAITSGHGLVLISALTGGFRTSLIPSAQSDRLSVRRRRLAFPRSFLDP